MDPTPPALGPGHVLADADDQAFTNSATTQPFALA